MKPIRSGLAFSLALFCLCALDSSAWSQIRRPGGSFGGTRPGGSFSGTRPGGITGIRPPTTIIRPPTFRPPTIPTVRPPTPFPGTVTGTAIGTTGMPGSTFARTWHCPRCNREVGRGSIAPAVVNCCGQTYMNGKGIGIRMPGALPPSNPPVAGGGAPPNPALGMPTTTASTGADGSTGRSASGLLIAVGIGVIVFGLAVLGGVAVLVVQSQRSSVPTPKRRRLRDD